MVKPHTAPDPIKSFNAAALGMGWQLAVVVLAAVFGGYKLDQVTGMSPLWTLVGLVLAVAGTILVVRRALRDFGNFTPPASDDSTNNTTAHDKERPL